MQSSDKRSQTQFSHHHLRTQGSNYNIHKTHIASPKSAMAAFGEASSPEFPQLEDENEQMGLARQERPPQEISLLSDDEREQHSQQIQEFSQTQPLPLTMGQQAALQDLPAGFGPMQATSSVVHSDPYGGNNNRTKGKGQAKAQDGRAA